MSLPTSPVHAHRECAQELLGQPGVEAADVIESDPRTCQGVLEVVVGPRYERVPPRVLRKIIEHDLGIRAVTPRGEPRHLIVEVV